MKYNWFVVALCIQLSSLFGMMAIYYSIVSTGTHVYMPIQWVDPRDPFRGEFVRLNYPLSEYRVSNFSGDALPFIAKQTVYALLDTTAYTDGALRVDSITSVSSSPYATGVWVRATIDNIEKSTSTAISLSTISPNGISKKIDVEINWNNSNDIVNPNTYYIVGKVNRDVLYRVGNIITNPISVEFSPRGMVFSDNSTCTVYRQINATLSYIDPVWKNIRKISYRVNSDSEKIVGMPEDFNRNNQYMNNSTEWETANRLRDLASYDLRTQDAVLMPRDKNINNYTTNDTVTISECLNNYNIKYMDSHLLWTTYDVDQRRINNSSEWKSTELGDIHVWKNSVLLPPSSYLSIRLNFWLDRYFVQKGQWTPLENAIRWSSTAALASRRIGRWGRVVLDSVVVNGSQRY